MNKEQKMTRTTELLKEIEELYYDDGKCMFDDNDTGQWKAPDYLRLKGELRGRLDALKDELLFLEGDDIIGCIIEADYGSCHEIPKWYLDRLASIREEIKLITEGI